MTGMKNKMLWVVAGLALVAAPVGGQQWTHGEEGWCDRSWGSQDDDRFCEVLTATLSATGALEIDGGVNGGVNVEGWDSNEVEVRAKVWANAPSADRAEQIARAVRVHAEGGRVSADGPETGRRENWGVSYEIRVPRSTDLEVETHNGGINVTGISGDIRFDAQNGGIHLVAVAGDVKGRTTNGGLHVELAGERWAGAGLDAETQNGGIQLIIPEDYSAELVTGTVNGGIDVDFPVEVRGRLGRRLTTTLGDGGPTIRVVTTNGGVQVSRR
jgi:DUF4097 and DUF4098 domain-containing protein YvlB